MNAHFIAHENADNAQLKAHYHLSTMCNILIAFLLNTLFNPKHLQLISCGMPSGDFVNNSDEGYRTLIPPKITRKPKPSQNQGRREKGKKN